MADIFTYQLVRNIFNLHYCPFRLSSLLLSLFAFATFLICFIFPVLSVSAPQSVSAIQKSKRKFWKRKVNEWGQKEGLISQKDRQPVSQRQREISWVLWACVVIALVLSLVQTAPQRLAEWQATDRHTQSIVAAHILHQHCNNSPLPAAAGGSLENSWKYMRGGHT